MTVERLGAMEVATSRTMLIAVDAPTILFSERLSGEVCAITDRDSEEAPSNVAWGATPFPFELMAFLPNRSALGSQSA
jgi:hypothetical protein